METTKKPDTTVAGGSPETSSVSTKKKPVKDPKSRLIKPDHPLLSLNSSPHEFKNTSVPKVMWTVILALLPVVVLSVVYFRLSAVILIVTCVLASVITEIIVNLIKKEPLTIIDGSAAITGLLLALTLPPTLPPTSGILGAVFAIAIGKQVFGGLGYNIFNPALLGRAFLQASFPVAMTTWRVPMFPADGVTAATPLGLLKFEGVSTTIWPLITGQIGGSLGETCAVAIIAGGLLLLVRGFADWRIPLSFLGTVFVLSGLFWLIDPTVYANPLFHLFSGGLMLGAFFMATDMVTSPITPRGSLIFGFGAGVLVIVIRYFGGLPEGVMYSILLMNAITPLINRYTRPKYLGEVKA